MIPFFKPTITGKEEDYIAQVISDGAFSGDHAFSKKCAAWLRANTGAPSAMLTTSCTHALEMAALLLDIKEGDEVIMPSFTFSSTANAFILRGAKAVFVDIRPETMNIDERLIEAAVTEKTKAIVPVHYAGVSAEMDTIMELSGRLQIPVVEDAAQGLMSTYKGRAIGTFGALGTLSFHESKNFQCGEGGAILVNDPGYIERAEIIREKGTNRSSFFRGEVAKYSWHAVGSSYLPSELNAAFLYAQLENALRLTSARVALWERYAECLKPLADSGAIERPAVPRGSIHNGHIFYIKAADLDERTRLIEFLNGRGVQAYFHYLPLHSSRAGMAYGRFNGNDDYTTKESERLLRLPIYNNFTYDEVETVSAAVEEFYFKR